MVTLAPMHDSLAGIGDHAIHGGGLRKAGDGSAQQQGKNKKGCPHRCVSSLLAHYGPRRDCGVA